MRLKLTETTNTYETNSPKVQNKVATNNSKVVSTTMM